MDLIWIDSMGIMGQWGYSQNAGILAAVVEFWEKSRKSMGIFIKCKLWSKNWMKIRKQTAPQGYSVLKVVCHNTQSCKTSMLDIGCVLIAGNTGSITSSGDWSLILLTKLQLRQEWTIGNKNIQQSGKTKNWPGTSQGISWGLVAGHSVLSKQLIWTNDGRVNSVYSWDNVFSENLLSCHETNYFSVIIFNGNL